MKITNTDKLLLIFVKNILLGKVKTRIAKTKGDIYAFDVYKKLVDYTQKITESAANFSIHVYFSDIVIPNKWDKHDKFVQQGNDLGERMMNAFKTGFENDFNEIIVIGSDCPEITTELIDDAFDQLSKNDFVIGPAKDGGYYLLGMKNLQPSLFQNKNWSTDQVLSSTLDAIQNLNLSVSHLKTLSDIDTEEDLKNFPEFMP